ncbi:5-oxoprolinase subunit PxpB [Maribrevibacterium harenarium]|uniref:5-oxoprolinase subunit PxpB n=1 Tax=Maribrevibacterium harenarium TaxID=2589817 RepID=A0A501X371_9GAMM|nr:5-oxoprolinase subunit PxpB [Maribrevibacterium harenarium]TPE54941.1 5-oxoprolinase subunit PxpB [Maribrevibacterium harenarium]
MRLSIAGENALIWYLGEHGEVGVANRVEQASHLLKQELGDVLVDLVPSYASILIIFDLFKTDYYHIRRAVKAIDSRLVDGESGVGRVVTLPVYYGTEVGADLVALASRAGLTIDQVIDIHQQGEYRVYAIGFAPGFAYLGDVDPRIATPRLATPRQKVPRGAVGIADRQTAIYPSVSPGGWNLIGRCPQRMFNPEQEPTMPVQVGDRVKFRAIDKDEYLSLGGELDHD